MCIYVYLLTRIGRDWIFRSLRKPGWRHTSCLHVRITRKTGRRRFRLNRISVASARGFPPNQEPGIPIQKRASWTRPSLTRITVAFAACGGFPQRESLGREQDGKKSTNSEPAPIRPECQHENVSESTGTATAAIRTKQQTQNQNHAEEGNSKDPLGDVIEQRDRSGVPPLDPLLSEQEPESPPTNQPNGMVKAMVIRRDQWDG